MCKAFYTLTASYLEESDINWVVYWSTVTGHD